MTGVQTCALPICNWMGNAYSGIKVVGLGVPIIKNIDMRVIVAGAEKPSEVGIEGFAHHVDGDEATELFGVEAEDACVVEMGEELNFFDAVGEELGDLFFFCNAEGGELIVGALEDGVACSDVREEAD